MNNNNQHRNQQNGNRYFHQQPLLLNNTHQQQRQHNNFHHDYNLLNLKFNNYEDPYFYPGYNNSGKQMQNHRQDCFVQPVTQQRSWGKRAHEISPTTSISSMSRVQGESSPAPKRQLCKQNNGESSEALQNGDKANSHAGSSTQQTQSLNKDRPESHTKFIQNLKDTEWCELFKRALVKLGTCEPGAEVNVLLTLQPPRATWSRLKSQIHNDMMNLMRPLGVDSLFVFGSTLTGLDFVGSDLDYHVRLKVPPNKPEDVKKAISKTSRLVRSYHNQDFKFIYAIPSARVPIVRLAHQSSRTTCDVNFTSQFGYNNSCFIQSVLGYDDRIKNLAVILKLWSKSHKISERMVISNYCLVMLMIFYLQNLEHPMLDTIKNNQEASDHIIIDQKYQWNVFFNDQMNKAAQNSLSTCKLLEGFFEFYHKLNFGKYIVSLYNGQLIPRDQFKEHPDFEGYRQLLHEFELPPLKFDDPQTFIVQDGFELNINVGIKSKKQVDEFFEWIQVSHEKCLELKDKPFSTLLIQLFTELKLKDKPENKNRSKAKKKFHMTIYGITSDLKLCHDILSIQDKAKIFSAEDQQKFFFNHVCEGSIKFLKEIYLCTIVPEAADELPGAMVKRFRIILHVDTINGRKKINFKDDAAVISEIAISKKMNEKKVRFELDISLNISSRDNGKSINIEMVDNDAQKKTALPNFGNLFSANIPQALRFYLKKTLEEATKQPEPVQKNVISPPRP